MSPQDWWKKGMEDAAKIARDHKGSAENARLKRRCNIPVEAWRAIRDEERGEDIAADIISQKILLAAKGKRPV